MQSSQGMGGGSAGQGGGGGAAPPPSSSTSSGGGGGGQGGATATAGGGGGGGGMNAASFQNMQRLQQQLQAQYKRSQQQQQQQPQHLQQQGGSSGGGTGMDFNNHAFPQQAFNAAAQQPQQQQQQGGGVSNGSNNRASLSNSAIALMQQQQKQQQQQQNANATANYGTPQQAALAGTMAAAAGAAGGNAAASMFQNWAAQQQQQQIPHQQQPQPQQQQQQPPQQAGTALEASSQSSARIMAMAGMGMPHVGSNQGGSGAVSGSFDSSSAMQNMQFLIQQQQQQAQAQQQQQNASFPHQPQQVQQQPQQLQQPQTSMMMGGSSGQQGPGGDGPSTAVTAGSSSTSMNPQQQQQLLLQQQFANLQKQMQQGHAMTPANAAAAAALRNAAVNMQGSMMQAAQQAATAAQQHGSTPNNSSGTAAQQNLMQARQQQLLQHLQQQQQQAAQQKQQGNAPGSATASASAPGGTGTANAAAAAAAAAGMLKPMPMFGMQLPGNVQQQQMQGMNAATAAAALASSSQGKLAAAQQQQQQVNSSSRSTSLSESQLRLHQQQQQFLQQQQQLQRSSSTSQTIGSDARQAAERMLFAGATQQQQLQAQQQMHSSSSATSFTANQPQQQQGGGFANQQQLVAAAGSTGDMSQNHETASVGSHAGSNAGSITGGGGNSNGNDSHPQQLQPQQPFLDGNFAGGWQSNDDLPDRRRIIFHILDVIRLMRPNDSKVSNKLPHMAKSLEEHLYRSAQSKEDYLDMTSLRPRLQKIAQSLELHRSTSSPTGSQGSNHSSQQQRQPSSMGMASFSQQQPQQDQQAAAQGGGQNSSWSQQQQQQPGMQQGNFQQQQGAVGQFGGQPQQGSLDASQQQQQQQQASSTSGMGAAGGGTAVTGMQGQQGQQNTPWGGNALAGVSNINPSAAGNLQNPNAAIAQAMQNLTPQQQQQLANNPALMSKLNNFAAMQKQRMGQQQANVSSLAASLQQAQADNQQQASASGFGQQSLGAAAVSDASLGMGSDSMMTSMDMSNDARFQDPSTVQKKRVILQQQQRLLLLRHASKCTAGPNCPTRFCSQMVTLWRHMKTCRDRNCRTSHCLSSRCVLNHYRICKSNGKTASCEVCGPVMSKIKQLERDDGTSDPLTREQDHQQQQPQQQAQPTPMGLTAAPTTVPPVNAPLQQQQPPPPPPPQQTPQSSQSSQSSDQQQQTQLQQLQSQQMKLQARLENLQQLQKQQNQLLEQQRRLQEQAQNIKDPNSQQAQQLQQQQMLLSQLQKRCQQQQLLLQRELQEQAGAAAAAAGGTQQLQQQLQQQQSQPQQGANAISAMKPQAQSMLQQPGAFPTPQQQQQQQQQQQLAQVLQPGPGIQPQPQQPQLQSMPQAQPVQPNMQLPTKPEPAKKRRSRSENKGKMARRRGSGKGSKGLRDVAAVHSEAAKKPASKKRANSTAQGSQKKAKAATATAKSTTGPQQQQPSTGEPKKATEVASAATPAAPALDTSLMTSLTKEEISQHLESLNKKIWLSSRTVTHKCLPVIQDMIDDQFGWVFHDAVDPVALGLPDYFDVVKNPMYLELVKKKLENAIYSDMESFERDVKLVFENAILYNGEQSEVGELAQTMLTTFDKLYKVVVQGIETSQQRLESKGEACSLCGTQKRKFEPTVLYCQGKCGMQRIKRQAPYFTDRTKQNHWCNDCYKQLTPDDPIVLDDGSDVLKKDLQELKNDAVPEEGWVNCDECKSWVHQICSLFNGRTNRSTATYTCPTCYLAKLDVGGGPIGKPIKGATDLPESNMSRVIEKGLADALQLEYNSRAKELGVRVEEVEKAEGLSVRVLSNVEKKHIVGDEMLQYYSDKECPTEFPVRSKCLALFQKIHGVDSLLFALYVYEYGHDCPAPNKRRVYISYLDSVQYFEPKCYRTTAYQAVILEYLRYVKNRGFHTAHIWSCPPTPGDDYIFYYHPEHQKIPREDMLRTWYHNILDAAKTQGVVIRTTSLYDEYFASEPVDPVPGQRFDARCLPYFEGDYIPGEIENIVRQLKGQNGAQAKVAAKGSATRDAVMERIGHNLRKMKDSFIVVHLRNRRFAAAVERGEDVSHWKEDSDEEVVRSKRAKISGKMVGEAESAGSVKDEKADLKLISVPSQAGPSTEPRTGEQDSKTESVKKEEASTVSSTGGSSDVKAKPPAPLGNEAKKEDKKETKIDEVKTSDEKSSSKEQAESSGSAKADEQAAAKPAGEETKPEGTVPSPNDGIMAIKPAIARHFAKLERPETFVSSTADEDEPFESDLFESRQQFLNYCQTTHCQFDELRRAKHSTMMVLFQLHNPSAPKFLQQCGACYVDITHGIRYHCNKCPDFDLCEDCYKPVTTGLWAKRDARFAHDTTHTFAPINMEAAPESKTTREERQKALKAHIALLEHAGKCSGPPTCSLQNCARMKGLFLHVRTCDVKPKKDCRICSRLLSLCAMHSRMCPVRTGACPIPFCDRIRERQMRLRRQQQQMDDRRRQAQNELYHAGDS